MRVTQQPQNLKRFQPVQVPALTNQERKQMHDLQVIKKLNNEAAAKVRGHCAACNHSAKVREIRDRKADKQRKANERNPAS